MDEQPDEIADGGPLQADEPIASAEQDQLNRHGFARQIATQLINGPVSRGFVIGIAGPWGSGKTSLLNLIIEAATSLDEEIVVLRFDPWLFSRTDELVARFLAELGSQFRESNSERMREIGNAVASYGERLTPLGWIPFAGGWLARAGRMAESIRSSRPEKSLEQQRKTICDLLRQVKSRVIVVIDDIDRLEPAQIREVVRLVKLVADFPNVTYLVAYDEAIVANALGETPERGAAYLEKIVQSTHHLPEIDSASLSRIFLGDLDGVISPIEPLGEFFRDDWLLLYERGIKRLLRTVRDVRRYLNALPVALRTLGDEIALADLLALEAIRVFAPKTFTLLPSAISALTGERHGDLVALTQAQRDEDRAVVEGLIAAASPHEEAVAQLIQRLFPRAGAYAGGSNLITDGRDARRKRLARDPSVLRIYLFQHLADTAAPAKTVADVFARLDTDEDLGALLAPLEWPVLEDLIGRLEDFAVAAQLPNVALAVPALMNLRRRLREGRPSGFFDFDPETKLIRVVLRLLERVPTEEERLEIVRRALSGIEDISARVELVDAVGHRENVGQKLIAESEEAGLIDDLARQIDEATTQQLRGERDLGTGILGFLAYQRPAAIPSYVERLTSDEFVFIQFVRSGLSVASSTDMSTGLVRQRPNLPYPFWLEHIDEERLRDIVSAIRERSETPLPDERDELAIATVEAYLRGERRDELARRGMPGGHSGEPEDASDVDTPGPNGEQK